MFHCSADKFYCIENLTSYALTTYADRQSWKKILKDTDTQAVTHAHRQADRQTDAYTDRHSHSQTHRQTDRQAGRQTDREIHRQTDRQTDRQTVIFTFLPCIYFFLRPFTFLGISEASFFSLVLMADIKIWIGCVHSLSFYTSSSCSLSFNTSSSCSLSFNMSSSSRIFFVLITLSSHIFCSTELSLNLAISYYILFSLL